MFSYCTGMRLGVANANLHINNHVKQYYIKCWVLTVLLCGASVCLLITMVVVFRSVLGPPGDFGTSISVGLEGLFTNNSAALTTSNTWRWSESDKKVGRHIHMIHTWAFSMVMPTQEVRKNLQIYELLFQPAAL